MHKVSGLLAGRLLLAAVVLGLLSCSDKDTTSETSPAKSPSAVSSNKKASELEPFRIMPLGDSITQGDKNHNSYRRLLWKRLKMAGFEVDFVGNQRDHHRGDAPTDDFDQDHEGHWGWRVDQILDRLERWATTQQPDAVLIHLGSNDLWRGQSVQSTVDELAEMVTLLRRVNSEVVIIVAQIIPTNREPVNREIRKLNDAIALLASQLDSPQSPVRVVDQYSGFSASEDTYDGVHPNERGEAKMAARWQEVLAEFLGRGKTEPANNHLPRG